MPDRHTTDQRHRNMAAIHSFSTGPELKLRHALWRMGFRYRMNDKRLPGKPDVVLPRYRTAVFVHGCFWHGHRGCKYNTIPKTNTDFWRAKIVRNLERDQEVWRQLEAKGWFVIIVWECQLKKELLSQTITKIQADLLHNLKVLEQEKEKRLIIQEHYKMERQAKKEREASLNEELKHSINYITIMGTSNYQDRVRRKISGWYEKKELEDKAVDRIMRVRDEITELLQETGREGIDAVIQYLDDSGFYYRASSPNKHHNFPGGLAEHSLGTYKLAKQYKGNLDVPENSIIIAALLHDICKSDRFWFKGRTIRQHNPKCEMDSRHSVRSIAILKNCGLKLNEQERRAIRWHMKGKGYHSRNKAADLDHSKAVKETLWDIVFRADKDDAKAHPGKKR